MPRIGMGELIIIFLIILILFGARRLPEIGNAIGRAIKEFKKASKDIEDPAKDDTPDPKAPLP